MGNLCIIPARGGSKRIPRKNIKDFLGKPIIAYSIETALQSGLFDEVMVSTDDEEIAEVAKKYGAKVPFFRSEENSGDYATTADVLLEVIKKYEKSGKQFDDICCVYPTAPLVSSKHLQEGYRKFKYEERDTVFPVVAYTYPIWRGLLMDGEGKSSMIWPENRNVRSQDLETVYHDAGQWYWVQNQAFNEQKRLFTENSSSIILSSLEVQDIDLSSDWTIAEIKFSMLK